MPKGYVITDVTIHDAEPMVRYRELSTAAVAQYGGRFLVRGGSCEILEGDGSLPERLIVVEFDTVEQAKCFYHSPEYKAARKFREGAADMKMLLVSGVNNQV
ncbi:MAG: hypothetical protein H6R13_2244 [Proteobacteria bacterium]|nr:hypothetical protein [Pseudomonadota bacterium]